MFPDMSSNLHECMSTLKSSRAVCIFRVALGWGPARDTVHTRTRHVHSIHTDPNSQWLHCLGERESITARPVICIQMRSSIFDFGHQNGKCCCWHTAFQLQLMLWGRDSDLNRIQHSLLFQLVFFSFLSCWVNRVCAHQGLLYMQLCVHIILVSKSTFILLWMHIIRLEYLWKLIRPTE